MLIIVISVCLSFFQNLNTSSSDCEKVVGYEVLVVKLYFKLGESCGMKTQCMHVHQACSTRDIWQKLSGHSVKVYHDCMVHSRITKT